MTEEEGGDEKCFRGGDGEQKLPSESSLSMAFQGWTRRFGEADTKWLEGRQLGELSSNVPTLGFHQSN